MPYRVTPERVDASRRKRESIGAAARAIVIRSGFAAASVKAIAAEAGVSAGSVYSYFPSRSELLCGAFLSLAEPELAAVREAVERAGQPPRDRVLALVDSFAARALRNPRLAYALLVEPAGKRIDAERLRLRGEYHSLARGIVADGAASGELPRQDPWLAGAALIGIVSEALVSPLAAAERSARAPTEVIAEIERLCLRAVGAPSYRE